MKHIVVFFIFIFLSCVSFSYAEENDQQIRNTIDEIQIQGHKRISEETILSYINISKNSLYDKEIVDNALKRLFATGFFADIFFNYKNNILYVSILENPIINNVEILGNKAIEDKTLENEISIKSRHVYSKLKIQNEIKKILNLYRKSGRYATTIDTKIEMLPNNRVDIYFIINEGSKTKISNINFSGNKHYNDGTLKDVLFSKEDHILKFLSKKSTYDEEIIALDKELLKRFYNNKGYADFNVISSVAELTNNKKSFIVNYIIDEGIKYNFGELNIISSIKDFNAQDLNYIIQDQVGAVYNSELVDENIDKMIKNLSDKGFAFVDIKPEYKRNTENKLINITYLINEGPRVYIDKIDITGNNRTEDKVIRREFRFVEGDPYNTALIKRSENRVKALGLFEKVELNIVPSNEYKDKINININVMEKSTGGVELAGGYSTNDGVVGKFMISEKNFLGKGQELRFSYQSGTKGSNVELSFTEPYFMDKNISAGIDLYNKVSDNKEESSYSSKTLGVTFRSKYSVNENLNHFIHYSIKDDKIADVQSDASIYIQNQEGHHSTSVLGHNLNWDFLNDPVLPNDGYAIKISQDFAGLGGNVKFLKHEARFAYYIPLVDDNIYTKFTLRGGHVTGIMGKDLNVNQHFFSSGSEIRGFAVAGIGPRDSSTGDALGAKIYYVANSELYFPLGLPKELNVSGSAFFDIGSFIDTDVTGVNVREKDNLRASIGFGILWNSAMGPIKMDFAKVLLKDDFDKTQMFKLSIGARF